MDNDKIFVRLIDGVEVYVPINARKIDINQYEILPDEEFDYKAPNYLHEFYPGDIVTVSHRIFQQDKTGNVADQLIYQGEFKDRDYLEFKFHATLGQIPIKKESFDKYNLVIQRIKNEDPERKIFYPSIHETISKLDGFKEKK